MTHSINNQVDQSIRVLGFNFRKDIINTTELRLNRAMHLTHTDLFNAEQFQPQRVGFFSRQLKELRKLETRMVTEREITQEECDLINSMA
jgi:hypothetical protein